MCKEAERMLLFVSEVSRCISATQRGPTAFLLWFAKQLRVRITLLLPNLSTFLFGFIKLDIK